MFFLYVVFLPKAYYHCVRRPQTLSLNIYVVLLCSSMVKSWATWFFTAWCFCMLYSQPRSTILVWKASTIIPKHIHVWDEVLLGTSMVTYHPPPPTSSQISHEIHRHRYLVLLSMSPCILFSFFNIHFQFWYIKVLNPTNWGEIFGGGPIPVASAEEETTHAG